MHITGLIIAVVTFFTIGIFHPIVIKSEYYFGTRCWWAFAVAGFIFLALALWVENRYENVLISSILGVIGCSSFWSILEIFEQRERVRKGWFPKNPKRNDY